MITVLAGGVGAARLLRGMVRAVPASDVTAIVNTADDVVLHGLHVSPDLDTVTYTLAEAGNPWSASAARPGSASATGTSGRTSTGPVGWQRAQAWPPSRPRSQPPGGWS